jgi:peptide chain release factor subunit 1
MQSDDQEENMMNLEMFKLKRIIAKLDSMKGSGTSMITLIINSKDSISPSMRMLVEEVGKASNIKSRVTRQNVTDALTSAMEKLKLYNKTPPNGLIIFAGLGSESGGQERMIKIDLIPYKPINTSLYRCDSIFHTDELKGLLTDNERFGFLIMDGNGSLFGVVQGNTRTVLNKYLVDLPKKHGRGGQSANRFARIRTERRLIYLKKVAELLTATFITNDRPNVKGLILAGSAEFKNDLAKSDALDIRLQPIVIKLVDIAYGGEVGFNQAIELSQESLKSVKFVHEKKILFKFYDAIAKDTGKYVFGVKDTIEAMDNGMIDCLIIHDETVYNRMSLKKCLTEELSVEIVHKNNSSNNKWKDKNNEEYDVLENIPLTEWLLDNYKKYVTSLEIVSDKSSEGNQFVHSFGGIGGILRYQSNGQMHHSDDEDERDEVNEDDFI